MRTGDTIVQEIPFRHIWNGTQNGLHCSFSLEHVDRAETQLTCNILVCQSELSANQQMIHINRNVAQVQRFTTVHNFAFIIVFEQGSAYLNSLLHFLKVPFW